MFLRSATVRTSGVETAPSIRSSAAAGAVCASTARAEAITTQEILRTESRDTRMTRFTMRRLPLQLEMWKGSVLFQHHFCGLDHRGHRIAHLKLHFVDTSLRYYALDQILAHAHHHMCHNAAYLDFDDFAFESVSR